MEGYATFYNSNEVFKLGLNPTDVEVDIGESLKLFDGYGFNPFERITNNFFVPKQYVTKVIK